MKSKLISCCFFLNIVSYCSNAQFSDPEEVKIKSLYGTSSFIFTGNSLGKKMPPENLHYYKKETPAIKILHVLKSPKGLINLGKQEIFVTFKNGLKEEDLDSNQKFFFGSPRYFGVNVCVDITGVVDMPANVDAGINRINFLFKEILDERVKAKAGKADVIFTAIVTGVSNDNKDAQDREGYFTKVSLDINQKFKYNLNAEKMDLIFLDDGNLIFDKDFPPKKDKEYLFFLAKENTGHPEFPNYFIRDSLNFRPVKDTVFIPGKLIK